MNNDDLSNIRAVVREEVTASEERMKAAIKEEGNAIRGEIGQFISENVIPLIEEKADKSDLSELASKSDIDKLQRSVDRIFAKDAEQDARLDKIDLVLSHS